MIPATRATINEWQVPANTTLAEIERFVIKRTLERTNGNKQHAADILGIYRSRLYAMIQKHGINAPSGHNGRRRASHNGRRREVELGSRDDG
jgi:DNA-binding NtrC family response regulator